ncbi:MAG TPA: hypothetical protein PLC79_12785, partial [Phycisphaerae bacterium]|nr:hypothetical protein [Phycisphaerae bacterium]
MACILVDQPLVRSCAAFLSLLKSDESPGCCHLRAWGPGRLRSTERCLGRADVNKRDGVRHIFLVDDRLMVPQSSLRDSFLVRRPYPQR